MRIKTTALVLSALLPLSVWAMPESGQKGQNGQKNAQVQQEQKRGQGQQKSTAKAESREYWRSDKMQQRQNAWFDRLELTPEQRQAFQTEMQEHHAAQLKSRTAHQDKLRTLLTDEQRVKFDQDREKMQQRMQKYMQNKDTTKSEGQSKRSPRSKTE